MNLVRTAFVIASLFCVVPAIAQIPENTIKIGVLTDMSGPFSDQVGKGSVVAAELAAEDFAKESQGLTVQILSADHQNKPDVGLGIARHWVDEDGVAAIVDLPNSGIALAVAKLMHDKHRTALASSSLTSDLTGKACAPTTVQWVTDTFVQGNSTVQALGQRDLRSWYFLAVDYALGQALERDATAALVASGGKAVGAVRSPLGTTDFSSPLLSAQSSGASVLALASTGADMINAIKQAGEFGITPKMTIAPLFIQLSDVQALGLQIAKGLQFVEAFYWDLNGKTRSWSQRFAAKMGGRMPTEDHAGTYSATLAFLRAARDAGTIEGENVVERMKATPVDDELFGRVVIRRDGRAVHDVYLFVVKSPAESKAPYDDYTLVATIPGEKAFRSLEAGGCPFESWK
ncbi:MAG: ABC transporter substrate-binding protein [Hyphomicrobiales bacterium]|nr:ABC transporter substrate-binding protein [Hyphomicrobiales bacterium]